MKQGACAPCNDLVASTKRRGNYPHATLQKVDRHDTTTIAGASGVTTYKCSVCGSVLEHETGGDAGGNPWSFA